MADENIIGTIETFMKHVKNILFYNYYFVHYVIHVETKDKKKFQKEGNMAIQVDKITGTPMTKVLETLIRVESQNKLNKVNVIATNLIKVSYTDYNQYDDLQKKYV